jgi:hypothetical protein
VHPDEVAIVAARQPNGGLKNGLRMALVVQVGQDRFVGHGLALNGDSYAK